eukprot:2798767-Alexandrium_andersonii.AAC.1
MRRASATRATVARGRTWTPSRRMRSRRPTRSAGAPPPGSDRSTLGGIRPRALRSLSHHFRLSPSRL